MFREASVEPADRTPSAIHRQLQSEDSCEDEEREWESDGFLEASVELADRTPSAIHRHLPLEDSCEDEEREWESDGFRKGSTHPTNYELNGLLPSLPSFRGAQSP
ncbi:MULTISPECIES: hypothetical protein [unclassified Bradyrhizobium]